MAYRLSKLLMVMFAAQCEVQGQTVKIFDNLQYQHNIKGGGCPYVLVQDHWRGKECRIKVRLLLFE